MTHRTVVALVTGWIVSLVAVGTSAQVNYRPGERRQPPTAQTSSPMVNACSLLPKAEVKKLIGATEAFDRAEPKEAATKTGSSCKYAGLSVQVGGNTFDGSSKAGLAGVPGMEAVPGIGDQAYLYNNPAGAVEVFVKIGARQLVISRPVETGDTFATVRPGVLALADALVAKLK